LARKHHPSSRRRSSFFPAVLANAQVSL